LGTKNEEIGIIYSNINATSNAILEKDFNFGTLVFFLLCLDPLWWQKEKSERLALTNGLAGWITMVKVARVDSPCVVVQ